MLDQEGMALKDELYIRSWLKSHTWTLGGDAVHRNYKDWVGGKAQRAREIVFFNPPAINVFVHVVGYQSVSLMISGIAVDAALKQGD